MELNLDGPQTKQFVDALINAFPDEGSLIRMVNYGMNENLAAIAGSGKLTNVVFNLIIWAESRGRTSELLLGAREENPHNSMLRRFAEQFAFAAVSGELERIVLKTVAFANPEEWRKRMSECELAVCRVEIPAVSGFGTGFLVGPDIALTNHHVMEPVIENTALQGDVVLRFDYKTAADGTTLKKGREYHLVASDNWLIDSSPVSGLDYALLKVDGGPGSQSVGSPMGSPVRGWLTPQPHKFEVGEPLFIIEHPKGAPLKFAPGSVTRVEAARNRVVYTTNTELGSSGSPCFTSEWDLVALHHYGDPTGNRGVVFSAILNQPKVRTALGM